MYSPNYDCFGFEPVAASVNVSGKLLQARVNVRHPARTVWTTLHGAHNGSIFVELGLENVRGIPVAPELFLTVSGRSPPARRLDLRGQRAVKSLFLASCEALDLCDYNNVYAMPDLRGGLVRFDHLLSIFGWDSVKTPPPDEFTTRKARDPRDLRVAPGLRWWLAANHSLPLPAATPDPVPAPVPGNVTVLLGYNAPAPQTLVAGNATIGLVLDHFKTHLQQGLPGIEASELEPLAWVVANLEIGQQFHNPNSSIFLCFNACAWSADYYYYIPYLIPPLTHDPTQVTSMEQFDLPNLRDIRAVYRVPRANWHKNRADWAQPFQEDVGKRVYGPPRPSPSPTPR
jgi:hypothetical protein